MHVFVWACAHIFVCVHIYKIARRLPPLAPHRERLFGRAVLFRGWLHALGLSESNSARHDLQSAFGEPIPP